MTPTMASVANRGDAPPVIETRDGEAQSANDLRTRTLALGWIVGFAYAALCWIGAGRALNADAASTVRHFIKTPSVWDALTRQVVFNNHPFFSFLEHIVYDVTGTTNEQLLRVLPISCAAITIGILTTVLSRRFGYLASLTGVAVLGANPLFLEAAREVRGYSLLVLCAVVTSLMVLRRESLSRYVIYVVFGAMGIATHAYLGMVIAVQAAVIVARRDRLLRWIACWAVIGAAGLAAVVPALDWMGIRGKRYQASFPGDLVVDLLGRSFLAVLFLVPIVAVAVALTWRMRAVRYGVAVVVVLVLAVWLVVQPYDLYTRFFVWTIPLISVMIALVVSRFRWLAILAIASALAAFIPQVGSLTTDSLPNRAAHDFVQRIQKPGAVVCGLGWTAEGLGPYGSGYVLAVDAKDISECDIVVVLSPGAVPKVAADARDYFSRHHDLTDAESPATVYWDPRTMK